MGVGGEKSLQTKGLVTLSLQSIHRDISVNVQAHIVKSFSTILPSFNIEAGSDWPHLNKLNLADPDFATPRGIDIILGADFYGKIIKPNIIHQTENAPMAQLSIFGWLLLGPVQVMPSSPKYSFQSVVVNNDQQLDQLLTKFWVQEEIQEVSSPPLTPDDEECESYFSSTVSRDVNGRYVVKIPMKSSPSQLGDSLKIARQCLRRTLKRFETQQEYKTLYLDFLKEYEELGHMVKIPAEKIDNSPHFYLPHHGVLRPSSETTKLRVVFNGSSATSSGISVNDIMHTGKNLLLNIADVLTWIRVHKYLFSTDVSKMYRQIQIHPDDWDLQRILWVNENHEEVHFHLTTVTYGTKSAPYLAVRALLQLVEDEGHKYPLAVPSIIHGRYVDDIFGGADTEEELNETADQLTQLCLAGGFPLAKWHSTSQDLIKKVSSQKSSTEAVSFDDCSTKILGIHWIPNQDKFKFSSISTEERNSYTKRVILSEVATIFDPLGLVSPVVIRAKVLLQELWLLKLKWDDPLPSHIISKWKNIREDLISLAKLSIPRWFNTHKNSTVEIHGFSDASQLAMGAVLYLVVNSPSKGPQVTIINSKTKVAPLKRLTIPRLELTAALLLAKIVNHTKATLKSRLEITRTYLWTDSQVTLSWIQAHSSRWKDFVRNRVNQIHQLTDASEWGHVSGVDNPADCASRGVTTKELSTHQLWWTGPPWLKLSKEKWPIQQINSQPCTTELRPGVTMVATAQVVDYSWDLIHEYSSITKLLRVTSLCLKFIKRLQRQPADLPLGFITSVDMENSRKFWIKMTQAVYFSSEIKLLSNNQELAKTHPLRRLTAFIDEEGIIRVGGRLEQSSLSTESKHPAILPRKSRLTELLIAYSHKITMHGGTQLTLANLRQRYWILGGRAPVKSHVLRCVVCARHRGIRAHQLMGQLPLSRVTPSRAFEHTGVDYAGPITLKTIKGRGAKTFKAWISVFVCFTTSAIHLEAVCDYTADGFIAAYRRFISRRGRPSSLYSDCGTNFQGAEKELKKLFKQFNAENQGIASMLAKDNTQWHFNPPAAPHMGGKWEAAVKLMKFHLRRTVGDSLMTLEELTTVLTQIEAILNSRPLEPLSDDPEDLGVLTPGHFLIGTALTAVPEPSLLEIAESRLSHWQDVQKRVQLFWSRWLTQYLHQQQAISKWHYSQDVIKEGSIVLIKDERFPPGKWPLARVVALYPGSDKLTRVVGLKTATTTLTRPIHRLVIVPVPTQPVN